MEPEEAHSGQLTLDPAIAPSGVLPCHPKDLRYGASGDARPPWSVGLGPATTDQMTVPAQQSVGLHEEPSQTSTAKEPTQSSEQRSIGWSPGRASHLTTQDVNLVAEHDDLDRQFFVVMPDQAEQFDDSDEGEVERGQGHGPVSSPRPTPRKSCSRCPDGAFGTHRLLTKFRRSPRDQSEDLIHRSWLFLVGEPGDHVALSSR